MHASRARRLERLPRLLPAVMFALSSCAGPAAPRPVSAGDPIEPAAEPPDPRPVDLAVGENHGCAVLGSGEIVCWGQNGSGQLGRPPREGSERALEDSAPVADIADAVQVTVGYDHTCALAADGRVLCFGANVAGQLGGPDVAPPHVPRPVEGLEPAARVEAGYLRTCAIARAGSVFCWGRVAEEGHYTPRRVEGLDGAIALAVTETTVCALRPPGEVLCDVPTTDAHGNPLAESVVGIVSVPERVVQLAASPVRTCALGEGGGVHCWRRWERPRDGVLAAERLEAPAGAVEIAAVGEEGGLCLRVEQGRVLCVGGAPRGDGVAIGGGPPTAVPDLGEVVRISGSSGSVCAQRRDGAVRCWGAPFTGYEPDLPPAALSPVKVGRLDDARQLATGITTSCVVRPDDTTACWGSAYTPYRKGARHVIMRAFPTPVVGVADVAQVEVGELAACALHRSGEVTCWGVETGSIDAGYLVEDQFTPSRVPGLDDAIQISLLNLHACALRRSGLVACWGNDGSGQLGDGATTSRLEPRQVRGLSDAVQVAVGAQHSCAIVAGGAVVCWGGNRNGQLGDGTTEGRLAPTLVSGLPEAAEVEAGFAHTCARTTDGAVYCWGRNGCGELGDGTLEARTSPVPVVGLSGVVDLAVGSATSCARLASGETRCWGQNQCGQTGDGTADHRPTPVRADVPPGAVVAPGNLHGCALLNDGHVRCWGCRGKALLGDGSAGWTWLVPREVLAAPSGGSL